MAEWWPQIQAGGAALAFFSIAHFIAGARGMWVYGHHYAAALALLIT